MIDVRLRSQIPDHHLQPMLGKLLTDRERSLTLTGPAIVRKPSGALLCVYLPGILQPELDAAWETLSAIRQSTDNRGNAGAAERHARPGAKRSSGARVLSAIVGSYDDSTGPMNGTCRLTAFTVQNEDKMTLLRPLLQRMDALFREHVGDRYEAQAEYADRTHEEWLIPGTVYTTVTVNNTYATGVHTDKGDLDAGFSCLAVARHGDYSGGALTFPKYGVGVDTQHGDLLLMDAHEMHGNTPITCSSCGAQLFAPAHRCMEAGFDATSPERVSVVAYYRTKMEECDTLAAEQAKRVEKREQQSAKHLGLS